MKLLANATWRTWSYVLIGSAICAGLLYGLKSSPKFLWTPRTQVVEGHHMLPETSDLSVQMQTLLTKEVIISRVEELAKQIAADYQASSAQPLLVLVLLQGAFVFASDLIRAMPILTEVETMRLSSYRGAETTGVVHIQSPIPKAVKGRRVLIVEDIVDSGITLSKLVPYLQKAGALSVQIVTLLDKRSARKNPLDIQVDYTGFKISDQFVIGYGLDYRGLFRNLPYIAILDKETKQKTDALLGI